MSKTLLNRRPDHSGQDGQERRLLRSVVPGAPVENRRQLVVKLSWMSLWMIYLLYPVGDLASSRHGTAAKVAGAIGLVLFLACYFSLVAFRSTGRSGQWRGNYVLVGLMLTLATVSSFGLGQPWLTLYTYASVCTGAVLAPRLGLPGVALVTALALAVSLSVHADLTTLISIVLPCFLGGFAMTGLQRLIGTMRELREARAAVAHLAAAEERLRLARDLHDLLGHSLSLITIKSELAGRLMDQDKQEAARAQVADIESVARQSLIDVREAVGGYRRPTLPVELAAARSALTAAQITLEADPSVADGRPGLGTDETGALAWALREAVTNVVRHGEGATVCTVTMDETWEGDGERYAVLEIADNGRGPGKSGPGNGLSGLEERLALVDGRLETGVGARGKGFRLRALVPLRTVTTPAADAGASGS
ncbi:histidine kinase [Kitasatospora sp. MAP5-34]|uniref:sensor histidine kinase n=1 Tax=Kitasatospora sp. MAP5-34 TaxID=3035102 RepID=UPI002474990B|nr:histidine kinase [Kitasatospora sp. MAP5-34]